MAVPVRKTSRQKKHSRRGHIELTVSAVYYDATIDEYRLSRRISPNGYYKGRQVAKKVNSDD